MVSKPDQLEVRTTENLKKLLSYADEKKGSLNDSVKLLSLKMINNVYQQNNYKVIWSHEDQWKPLADSLFQVVQHAKEYGLYPADYNYSSIASIKSILQKDSISRRDAALWSRADILFTEAYLDIARHLKLGRLQRDSISLRKDSLYNDQFFTNQLIQAISNNNIVQSLQNLEPPFPGYRLIRENIKSFLDSANFKDYTYLYYPFKDSLLFIKSLQKRLVEVGYLAQEDQNGDSATISQAVRKYQKDKNYKSTGKISETLVRSLNNSDIDKFRSIAASLDSYKMLPDTLPSSYIIVNLPSYTLYVYNKDTLVFQSKVIVGSPKTRTPLLNSRISNFITYPQWTVPYSIIFRDMLPKIQKDVRYLDKQNLMVVDRNDSVLNPNLINWASLNDKHFPYLIRQKQGDDNSLGVIKFNFANKYSVYLHDTNARWLFGKPSRDLSHGCVRVQGWAKLSNYLVRADTVKFPADTLKAWIVRQEKHTVSGFPRVPLFIRYFTVEGKDGMLKFYNDIYGDDRVVKEKYFVRRNIH
jgi:murein L,D-transpeptidase YcbB/YkuD